MKLTFLTTALLLTLFSSSAFSTEYIYRDLMANTLPSIKCELPSKAIKRATKPYKVNRYVKKFCQTQGYGWGVEEVKHSGQVTCNECADNNTLQKCHIEDIVVSCKRIKPGTVGMLPGQG